MHITMRASTVLGANPFVSAICFGRNACREETSPRGSRHKADRGALMGAKRTYRPKPRF
jgi:hypothetical protein